MVSIEMEARDRAVRPPSVLILSNVGQSFGDARLVELHAQKMTGAAGVAVRKSSARDLGFRRRNRVRRVVQRYTAHLTDGSTFHAAVEALTRRQGARLAKLAVLHQLRLAGVEIPALSFSELGVRS